MSVATVSMEPAIVPAARSRGVYAATGAAPTSAGIGLARAARDEQRDQPAQHQHGGTDPQRGDQPVDDRLRRRVAPGAGEHGREDRDAEHAAELADRVVGARRLAGLLRAHGPEHRVGGGGEHERHAGPAHDERGHEDGVGDVGRGHDRQPAERDRLEEQAGRHQRARAEPVGQHAGDRGDEHRHAGPGQRPQARLERRVALDGLEELGEQEDRPEHPERHREADAVRGRERALPEEPHRQHRRGRAQLPGDERDEQDRAGGDRPDDLERAPAGLVAAHDAEHDAEEAERAEREAGQVEPARRAARTRPAGGGRAGRGRARSGR